MLYPNLDVSEMFVDREAQRSSMHSRHLNEQLVRVLKTIGYDVGFQKGQGQYLFDRGGARYLDLLSGFGVFAIGRNHPVLREALKSVLNSDLPNLVQLDVSTLAGVLAERCSLTCLTSIRSFCEFRRGMCRSCDQICALRNRTTRHRLLRSRVPRTVLWRAVADRRRQLPCRLRTAAAGLHVDSLQRSRSAGEGAVVAPGCRLCGRADPGQRRQHADR